MSLERKTIEPKTDFELVLNYSNQCIWENLNNDPGASAGADAASRVGKTFCGTDPLSEIVWSPDKGFSLKCVDSSFTNKNTSLFGDPGPSSMVLALLQSVTGGSSTTDKPTDNVFVEPIAVLCTKSDISSTDTPARHPASDSVVIIPDHKICEEHHDTDYGLAGSGDHAEKINIARGTPTLPNCEEENLMSDREKNICAQANIGTTTISETKGNKTSTIADEPKSSMEENPSPMKHYIGGTDAGVVNHVVETEDGLYTGVEHIIEYKGSGAVGTNLISSGISPSQKLESTAENDLQILNCEATCAATSTVLVSKSNLNENKSQVNEMMLLCNKNLPVMDSQCKSRIHVTRNEGKQKSLSNGDSNVSLPKEENDCHLSVESCHSTGLFLTGKKRCNFQQVITGSKKVKTQIQEALCSKSYIKPDSSFMNLISNMRKGCSQSAQDEDKRLAPTLENPDQKLIMCNMNQDPDLKNAGFRSNFQPMFCPKFKNVGTRMSHQVGEASKDVEQGSKVHGIDAAPISFYGENNSLYRLHLLSNKLEVSRGRHDACPPLQPQTRPINSINSHKHRKSNSLESENYYNFRLSKEKEGMTSMPLHSPSIRPNKNTNENVESYALCERKEICHKSDTLGGIWITRFSPKSTSPLIVFDPLNKRGGSEVDSMHCSMLPHTYKHISLNNCKIEEAREQSADDQLLGEAKKLHNWCINKESSTVVENDKRNHNHTSKHKFNSVTPFPVLRDSGPMVSMFARRVGAIKQCQLTE